MKDRFNFLSNIVQQEIEKHDDRDIQCLVGKGKVYETVGDFADRNENTEIELLLLYRIGNIVEPISFWKLQGKELSFLNEEKYDQGTLYGRIIVQGCFLFAYDSLTEEKAFSWFTYSECLRIASSLRASIFTTRHKDPSWRRVYRLEIQRDKNSFNLSENENGI